MKLPDLDNHGFDPFEVERLLHGAHEDPYPLIHEPAAKGPIHKLSYRMLYTELPDVLSDKENYLVLGYDACQEVLANPHLFANGGAFQYTIGRSFGHTLSVMDAPEHPKYRKIFQKAFLPQVVSKWGESVVEPVINDLIGAFSGRGEADLIEEFTHHYPFQVIYRQLRLQPEQAPIFHRLAIAQLLGSIGAPEGPEASKKLGAFFEALIEARRADPEDDLVSHLATVEADGGRLPNDVLISFLRQLMNAGGDTTYRGTSVLLTGLLTHPDQFAAVAADRSLAPQAIDEALRWEGPVTSTWRYVSEDAEVAGTRIAKGAILNVVLGSANRDPAKFENPDAFNIFRERSIRHLAFASGPHVCIGQHLARVEMTRALNGLIDRLPNLRLHGSKPGPDIRGHQLRVPKHLFVEFDAAGSP
ncbi:MAG: cytochrome P450 [Caulobacteraceae bacterium]|nr:cytochrome P450 [Caulobacteraceae bacterium]